MNLIFDRFGKIKVWIFVSLALIFVSAFSGSSIIANACTLMYAGENRTEDGNVIFGRSEDASVSFPKTFEKVQSAVHKEGEKYEGCYGFTWKFTHDSYGYTAFCDDISDGICPDCGQNHEHTPYQSAGTNEKGLTVTATESIFDNQEIMERNLNKEDGIEEAEMATILLSEAASAREAMELLTSIYDKKGAYSGAAVLVADADEAWYIECLAGGQYVAVKMNPDLLFFGPNLSVIGEIDLDDKENIYASKDVIKTAVKLKCFVGNEKENIIDFGASYEYPYEAHEVARLPKGLKFFSEKNRCVDKNGRVDRSRFCISNIDSKGKIVLPYTNIELDEPLSIRNAVDFYKVPHISRPETDETHIFEINGDGVLGTVEWVAFGEARYSVFVPHFPRLIYDVYSGYSKGCGQPDECVVEPTEGVYHLSTTAEEWVLFPENWQESFYWVFEELMYLAEESDTRAEYIMKEMLGLQQEIYADWETNKADIEASARAYYGDSEEMGNAGSEGSGGDASADAGAEGAGGDASADASAEGTGGDAATDAGAEGVSADASAEGSGGDVSASQAMQTPEEMATSRSSYMAEKVFLAAVDILKEYDVYGVEEDSENVAGKDGDSKDSSSELSSDSSNLGADSQAEGASDGESRDSVKSGIQFSTILLIFGAVCAAVLVVILASKKKRK